MKLPRGCRDERGYMKPRPCRIGRTKRGAPTIFVYGDSHAGQMLPAVERAIGKKRINLVLLMLGACPPMLTDPKRPGGDGANVCQEFGNDVAERFRKLQAKGKVFRVVAGMGWQLYHNVLSEPDDVDRAYPTYVNPYIRTNAHRGRTRTQALFEQLGRWGVRVDLVGQLPMVYERAPECEQGEFECDLPRRATLKDAQANRAQAQRLRKLVGRSGPLISPASEFCDRKVCRGTIDGVPTYFDRFHIGKRASRRLASYFKPTVKAVQRADKRARKAARR
ncbi:MAG: hypothetical protein CMH83_13665 [Nocardioides sp.]|nr:hypothetical protein [Nocardioides sp.]